jgi:hypothetical protein
MFDAHISHTPIGNTQQLGTAPAKQDLARKQQQNNKGYPGNEHETVVAGINKNISLQ